jgi:hypothetical protein
MKRRTFFAVVAAVIAAPRALREFGKDSTPLVPKPAVDSDEGDFATMMLELGEHRDEVYPDWRNVLPPAEVARIERKLGGHSQ